MWIRGLSAVATQLAFCLAGFFQGRKDVTTPMWAGIIGNLVNIVLDIVLIFGVAALGIEPMGIAGAAWATTIGAYVQTAVLLYAVLLPRQLRQRYALQRPRMPRLLPLWKVIRVGVPASVYGFLDMGFFLLFTSYVGRQGEAALAANQITVQLLSFSFMPVFGLSVAATVLVGNALGAKNPDLAVQYARECFLVSVFYCSAVAVIFVCGGQHIFALFSTDPEVLILAAGLAQAAAVFQFFDGAQLMGNGVLGGAGDTRVPMLYTLVSLWLLALPAVYWVLVVAEQSVLLGWFAAAAGYGVMATAIFVRVYRGRWRHLKLLQATDAAVLNGST
jgi:MATE family multidrug resistance protein